MGGRRCTGDGAGDRPFRECGTALAAGAPAGTCRFIAAAPPGGHPARERTSGWRVGMPEASVPGETGGRWRAGGRASEGGRRVVADGATGGRWYGGGEALEGRCRVVGDDDARAGRDEVEVRRLLRSWMRRTGSEDRPVADPLAGTGLGVPPAPAGDVIAAARRVAGGRVADATPPAAGLRLIAEAMVLDEHPSASGWTEAERRDALHWITLVIHRFGEDGVQRLVTELHMH
jgi:hypothetical protein